MRSVIGRDERGMTLPEVLVAMVISGLVTGVLLLGMVSVYRGQNFTQQDSSSLGALRTALDRFEKEVRQARVMYDDSTQKMVHLWVDYDRDNQQDLSEQITWQLEDLGGDRAQLTRATEAAPSSPVVVARNLVFDASAAEFEYNATPVEEATLIRVRFVARAAGSIAGQRTVRTEVRLRNANFENA
jgi:prepilin-type N-terminal cleavage/methylation domain-containing protein